MATFNRIDKLRFVKVLRPHIGERDEYSMSAMKDEMAKLRNDIRHDQHRLLIWAMVIWSALVAAAVAIAQLF